MEIEDILTLIYELQVDIFNAQLNTLPQKFASFSTSLESIYRSIPSPHEQYFKQILLAIIQAYEDKDYLLLADILEFELKTLLVDVFGEDYQHEIV